MGVQEPRYRPAARQETRGQQFLHRHPIQHRGGFQFHVGYGWKDDTFDFSSQENVDCLVCHDTTGAYHKDPKRRKPNLRKVAQNVGETSAAYVKKLIDTKAKVVIVDSRPTARKCAKGHVPTAISIPTQKFDKLTNLLPTEKSTPLIFYCGGFKCPLSPKGAAKTQKLSYTKVMLFQAGYPAWKKAYGPGPKMGKIAPPTKAKVAAVAIETSDEPDTITFDSFRNVVKNAPKSVHLIDVRDPEEYKAGSLPTAINMTVDDVEEKVAELPNDKPIVFICSTEARSGEAYDIVKPQREDFKIYFLNASMEYKKDGSYTLAPPEG